MNKKKIDIQEIKTLITTKDYYRFERDAKKEGNENSIQKYYDLSAGEAAALFDQIKAKGYSSWRRGTQELSFELYDSEKEEVEISNVEISNISPVISNTEEKEEEKDTTKIEFKSSGY